MKDQICPWVYKDTEDFNKVEILLDNGDKLKDYDDFMKYVTVGGKNSNDGLHHAIVNIHRMMRVNYLRMMYTVGRNIYPLIVAKDNNNYKYGDDIGRQAVGGVYELYLEDGRTYSVMPVPKEYEMFKALGHIPLGLYTIISPYFFNPSLVWVSEMQTYLTRVELAVSLITEGTKDMSKDYIEIVDNLLNMTREYVSTTIKNKLIDVFLFQEFTGKIKPFIGRAMDEAARLQVEYTIPALFHWKKMLGDELWSKLYAVVSTVWPVSDYSVRYQILKTVMDPERVDTNLLVLEGLSNFEDLRTNLGRIVADRLLAKLAFHPEDGGRGLRWFKCLSSHTDLVSDSCYKAIQEFIKKQDDKKE